MVPKLKPAGSSLRDKVAGLLKCIHAEVEVEKGLAITTADVFFTDESSQLFPKKIAVECKDWKKGSAYALSADYLGRSKKEPLLERLITFILNKVGIFKLKEMLGGGASIYSVDGPAAHMVFLSTCVSIERGAVSVDMREMKRFARDACQKSLYVSGFDAAPSKDAKIYSLKLGAVRGLSADIKEFLLALPPQTTHKFGAQVHGKPDELLAGVSNAFRSPKN